MKNIIKRSGAVALTIITLMSSSCSQDFLDVPAEGVPTIGNYYDSDVKLDNASNGLYGIVWFNMNKEGFYGITDVISGNMYAGPYNEFGKFTDLSFTSSQSFIGDSWRSCFGAVANCNSYINTLPQSVGPNVSKEALNNAMGEMHFIRAFAYFFLVRLWGNVPIIENNADYSKNFVIPSNPVEDVYKFIENDLKFAIDNLRSKNRGSDYAANAHVSSGSAKALLAKVYLYQKKYDLAKTMAQEVINSGEFKLLGGDELPTKSFADLWLQKNNNNEESIFSWQWTGAGTYFEGNFSNTLFAPENRLVETSYSGQIAPSQDLIHNVYEPGDKRRAETFMLPGDYYPNLTYAQTLAVDSPKLLGYTFEEENEAQNSGAGLKKYVIGKENLPLTGPFNAPFNGESSMNSYMMRYADLLLIHAEAILGSQSGSTSDPAALKSFNAVRKRAGLPIKASISFDDIFKERRAELACEGDYYFDLGRLPFAKAKAILEAQNRGDKVTPKHITISASNLLLPYPADDLIKNPKLTEVAPYTFK
ncbi:MULTISPECIES: RagB/SusD family nutrient uptake outer membrane protein [Flavobacterium]|uniref:RagB/SusD family nutrient uptake outer membrane protein n=1 Tax=Flavobacterium endoglycinae TaxID=2816357 RepID=A0ABX7QA89_9FLAO|nr:MULTISPECIES: RagB/SusD family nutrient uptake outer membrane protein [Flavobacterium]QSW87867.1 RagB/SusD family nutrient uptake outer membrane protein [Flavobacterium endoglycinae]